MKLFVNGQIINYEGDFKAESLLEFIEKKTLPPSTSLSSAEEAKKVLKKSRLRVFFFKVRES